MVNKSKKVFRITYYKSFGQESEIHARKVENSTLLGFIELSDFVYPQKSSIIIEPDSGKQERDFKDVKKTFIPIKDIHRIDEISTGEGFQDSHLKVIEFKREEKK